VPPRTARCRPVADGVRAVCQAGRSGRRRCPWNFDILSCRFPDPPGDRVSRPVKRTEFRCERVPWRQPGPMISCDCGRRFPRNTTARTGSASVPTALRFGSATRSPRCPSRRVPDDPPGTPRTGLAVPGAGSRPVHPRTFPPAHDRRVVEPLAPRRRSAGTTRGTAPEEPLPRDQPVPAQSRHPVLVPHPQCGPGATSLRPVSSMLRTDALSARRSYVRNMPRLTISSGLSPPRS